MRLLHLFIILVSIWPLQVFGYDTVAIADLKNELRVVVAPRDSIRILYNLYDLTPGSRRADFGWLLYDVASRNNNSAATLDILRQLTNVYFRNDSIMSLIESYARNVPESEEQKETVLFVQLQRISNKARYASVEQRGNAIRELLESDSYEQCKTDLFSEILHCYSICSYIGYSAHDDLSAEYFEQLGRLISYLPGGPSPLRSLYLTEVALLYSNLEQYDKAVAADKKLLAIIDQLEKKYLQQGRLYKDYSRNRYICYRRILRNYPALSDKEVDNYYAKVKLLAQTNPDISNDLNAIQQPRMYYLLAKKQYSEAIPLLETQLGIERHNEHYKRQILKILCEAAKACNDTTTLVNALSEYSRRLENIRSANNDESYHQLRARYDISTFKARNSRLELARLNHMLDSYKLIIIAACVVIVILIMAMIIMRKRLLKNQYKSTDKP